MRPGYLIEIAAQTAAAWAAAGGGAAPRDGRLVAVSDWRWASAARCDERITIDLVCGATRGPLRQFLVQLAQNDDALAEGTITVHAGTPRS